MLKPRAEIPAKDGKTRVKAPREIGSQFVRRKAQTEVVIGGERQRAFDNAVASGKLKKGTAAYKKAEKGAKAELRSKYNAAMSAIGVKGKQKYSKKEQAQNVKKAMEALAARGRGTVLGGRDGRSQFKDIAQAGNKYGTAEGERMFGKKGYAQVIRAATRTDKGGGKIRKTNRRAFQTTQKVREVTVDAKGRKTTRIVKDGARAIKYFDASKPIPKEFKGAVRQYLAQKKGSWKGSSAPMLGEDGYIGFKGKPTAKGRGGKTKSTANRTFQKKAEAKPKTKQAAKPAAKPAKETAKPKKATQTAAKPKEATPNVRRTAEADRLIAASKAREAARSKATPAAAPRPAAPKPAAPAPKKAPAGPVPPKGSGTPARKQFLEKQLADRDAINKKVREKGFQSISTDERKTLGVLNRLAGDFKKELDSFKPKKKKG